MKPHVPFDLVATSLLLFALMTPGMSYGQTSSAAQSSSSSAAPDRKNLDLTGRMPHGKTFFGETETGVITTVVGDQPCSSFAKSCVGGVGGDGGPAGRALLQGPSGLFISGSGDLLIVDSLSHRIKQVDHTTGTIITVAGNNHCYQNRCDGFFSGDGGPATTAELNNPRAVAADADGNIFFSDTNNNRVRRIDKKTGVISTVAGTVRGFSGDGGPATKAELNIPWGIALDASGNVFVADSGNGRVRRIDHSTGLITTVAGRGWGVSSGDGGPAISAGVLQPLGLDIDDTGNLFICGDRRVRRVDAKTGIISTIAGGNGQDFGGDGGLAVKAELRSAEAISVDHAGNVFVTDSGNHRVRRVDHVTGIITTVVGNGQQGYKGDGGPATSAEVSLLFGLAVDDAGNLFIADANNNRIRRVQMATAKKSAEKQ